MQARSQVWIWGGAFPGERGLFRVLSWKESGIFAGILRISGPFCVFCFFEKVDFFYMWTACQRHVPWENFEKYDWKVCIKTHYDLIILFQIVTNKICPKLKLWTIVDTLAGPVLTNAGPLAKPSAGPHMKFPPPPLHPGMALASMGPNSIIYINHHAYLIPN